MRERSFFAFALLAALGLVHAACGGGNPIDPSPAPVQLSCPASIALEATQPAGANTSFDLPTPREGRPPYAVECTPGTGSLFPPGRTRVDCQATDADQKQTSCSFNVEVRISRTLTRTRFLAFGDSITAGVVSPALAFLDNLDSYPYKLERLLRERYPAQEIVVLNRGFGGERPAQGAARLPGVLDADTPEVLLLLEGIVSIRQIPTATNVQHLRTMITSARQRGIDVIIATVMPVGAALEAREPGINAAVVRLNVEIGRLAQEFALGPPIDLYSLFHAQPQLIGRDSLHPTADGFTRIADEVYKAVVSRYHMSAP